MLLNDLRIFVGSPARWLFKSDVHSDLFDGYCDEPSSDTHENSLNGFIKICDALDLSTVGHDDYLASDSVVAISHRG